MLWTHLQSGPNLALQWTRPNLSGLWNQDTPGSPYPLISTIRGCANDGTEDRRQEHGFWSQAVLGSNPAPASNWLIHLAKCPHL